MLREGSERWRLARISYTVTNAKEEKITYSIAIFSPPQGSRREELT